MSSTKLFDTLDYLHQQIDIIKVRLVSTDNQEEKFKLNKTITNLLQQIETITKSINDDLNCQDLNSCQTFFRDQIKPTYTPTYTTKCIYNCLNICNCSTLVHKSNQK